MGTCVGSGRGHEWSPRAVWWCGRRAGSTGDVRGHAGGDVLAHGRRSATALFACLIIRTFQLVFSAGAIFFSHISRNSISACFFQRSEQGQRGRMDSGVCPDIRALALLKKHLRMLLFNILCVKIRLMVIKSFSIDISFLSNLLWETIWHGNNNRNAIFY